MSDVCGGGGRWSNEEHERFLLGIQLYGKTWAKVQQLVRTRNAVQVRSHAQKHFKKHGPLEDVPPVDPSGEDRHRDPNLNSQGRNVKPKLNKERLGQLIPVPTPLEPMPAPVVQPVDTHTDEVDHMIESLTCPSVPVVPPPNEFILPLPMDAPLPVLPRKPEEEEELAPMPPANPKMEITFSSMDVDEKMIARLLKDDESIITTRRSRDGRSRDGRSRDGRSRDGRSRDGRSRDGGSTDSIKSR